MDQTCIIKKMVQKISYLLIHCGAHALCMGDHRESMK